LIDYIVTNSECDFILYLTSLKEYGA